MKQTLEIWAWKFKKRTEYNYMTRTWTNDVSDNEGKRHRGKEETRRSKTVR